MTQLQLMILVLQSTLAFNRVDHHILIILQSKASHPQEEIRNGESDIATC
jgi:hypothetical protein